MAYDGWIEFNGSELINLSRTAQLAENMGIDSLWTDSVSVAWIQDALGGVDYDSVATAPWYDANYPASAEFAGIVPLALTGLDDSTLEASTIEYITAGGASGKARNKTLAIVASVAVLASTVRGADYGKRWLDKQLRAGGARTFCSGSDLRYFRFTPEEGAGVPPMAHRRDVSLTRGTSVTRKRGNHCSATWLITYTWTANDPFEYGEEEPQFSELGGVAVVGPGVDSYAGPLAMVEQECPAYDYSPIYDPLDPALVAAPTAPDFYPSSWGLGPGIMFNRWWTRLNPVDPTALGLIPMLTLTTNEEARFVRVSIWPSTADEEEFCDPLWTVIVSYIPAGLDFIVDGEQEAAYAWDGVSPQVRRTDSLVYGTGARPIQWSTFNDPVGLLVTLDVVSEDPYYYGDGSVRASLSLVPKSD